MEKMVINGFLAPNGEFVNGNGNLGLTATQIVKTLTNEMLKSHKSESILAQKGYIRIAARDVYVKHFPELGLFDTPKTLKDVKINFITNDQLKFINSNWNGFNNRQKAELNRILDKDANLKKGKLVQL